MSSHPSPSLPSTSALLDHWPAMGRDVQDHLGWHLRLADAALGPWPMPEKLRLLADQIDRLFAARDEAELAAFEDGILEVCPSLRAFALSLTRNSDQADDLVQDTMVRALGKRSSFQPGTNLNAWLFTILRNSFHSEFRKRAREVSDSDGDYAAQLVVAPEQMGRLNLEDLQAAFKKVAPDQLEALLLVGAQGLSYEEAAAACGVPIGTVKSRVNRARVHLAKLLGYTADDLGRDHLLRTSGDRLS